MADGSHRRWPAASAMRLAAGPGIRPACASARASALSNCSIAASRASSEKTSASGSVLTKLSRRRRGMAC